MYIYVYIYIYIGIRLYIYMYYVDWPLTTRVRLAYGSPDGCSGVSHA